MNKKTICLSLVAVIIAGGLGIFWVNSSLYAISSECFCHMDVNFYCGDFCGRSPNNSFCIGWEKISSTCIWESCSQRWKLFCDGDIETIAGGMIENCWSCINPPDIGPEPDDDGDGSGDSN